MEIEHIAPNTYKCKITREYYKFTQLINNDRLAKMIISSTDNCFPYEMIDTMIELEKPVCDKVIKHFTDELEKCKNCPNKNVFETVLRKMAGKCQ